MNSLTRHPAQVRDDQQVRDARYGESPSGSLLRLWAFADPQPRRRPGWTTQPSTTCRGTSS